MTFSSMYIALPYPISHGHWLKQMVSTCIKDALEWLDQLCASSTLSCSQTIRQCVYHTEGLGTRLARNLIPNPPSGSIYSQPHVLRFPYHILVKTISTGKVMMWTDLVTNGKFPQWQRKHFMLDQKMTGACEPAKCHNANQQSIQDLKLMLKVVSCVTIL